MPPAPDNPSPASQSAAPPIRSWPATRATSWQLRTRTLPLGHSPRLMGIVNVTPDSFSDAGKFFDTQRAIDHALQLEDDGADILDIGGESTRPYSDPVTEEDELRRVLPVLEGLATRVSVPLSIDTSKPRVAREAFARGCEILNDVTALTGDPEMVQLVRESEVGLCAMHMLGTPQTMQDDPRYDDVVAEVYEYLRNRRDALLAAGIARPRICLDPGIGFGKSHQHNLDLVRHSTALLHLQQPILVGHSRKGFHAKLLGDSQADRSAVTLGTSLALAAHGIQILRVHDVRSTAEALRGWEAGVWGVTLDE